MPHTLAPSRYRWCEIWLSLSGNRGLNHLPSGRFAANAAWLAVQVMAHNIARWTARIGLGEQVVTTTSPP